MRRICVLSGNEEKALCGVLERCFEVCGLIPLCGTSLARADAVIVTESAATHSIGAESALRRLLVSAVCRGIPVVFLIRQGELPRELLRYGKWLLCLSDTRIAGETVETLCRRYGLMGACIFERSTAWETVYEALAERCKKILISEDKQNVKTNRA